MPDVEKPEAGALLAADGRMNELGGVINSNTLQYLQTFTAGTKTRNDLTRLHDYNACNSLNLSFCAANLPCADKDATD